MANIAAMRGVPVVLQNATTTGNGVAIDIPADFTQHKINILAVSGVTSGAIQPESASNAADTSTWNPIGGGPITVVATQEIEYNFTGRFSAIRARISTTIAGGATPSVTVTYVGS